MNRLKAAATERWIEYVDEIKSQRNAVRKSMQMWRSIWHRLAVASRMGDARPPRSTCITRYSSFRGSLHLAWPAVARERARVARSMRVWCYIS